MESSPSLLRSSGIITSDSKFTSGCQWLSLMLSSDTRQFLWTRCARIYIQCFVLRDEVDELDNRHSGFWRSLIRKKSNLIRIFLWQMNISEAVCKRDWHNVSFRMKFRTRCAIHPGGCCTLWWTRRHPPHNIEHVECLGKAEKRYINVINYYYYYYYCNDLYSHLCGATLLSDPI